MSKLGDPIAWQAASEAGPCGSGETGTISFPEGRLPIEEGTSAFLAKRCPFCLAHM